MREPCGSSINSFIKRQIIESIFIWEQSIMMQKFNLNGTKVGEHIGGYTPFNMEVTNQIKDGENFVVVKVDNKRTAEGVPDIELRLVQFWWNHARRDVGRGSSNLYKQLLCAIEERE